MKRVFASISICLIVCITIILASCGKEFAKREYDDVEKIVQTNDRYAETNSVFNPIAGEYSYTASKFDGRKTLWTKNLRENVELEIRIDLSVSSGCVKIVYIDCDNNVTVLVECSQDSSDEQSGIKTISLTSGLNRIKIVGYDCKDLNLKMYFDEP